MAVCTRTWWTESARGMPLNETAVVFMPLIWCSVLVIAKFLVILNRDLLRDVIQMLHSTANPQVEYIVRTMKKWATDNHVAVMWIAKMLTRSDLNPLKLHSNGPLYSNMVIGTLSIDGGLLSLVQREGAWAGHGPPQCPVCCTKGNNPPINGQGTNFILFDVAL